MQEALRQATLINLAMERQCSDHSREHCGVRVRDERPNCLYPFRVIGAENYTVLSCGSAHQL